jgi:hypothetical protein
MACAFYFGKDIIERKVPLVLRRDIIDLNPDIFELSTK